MYRKNLQFNKNYNFYCAVTITEIITKIDNSVDIVGQVIINSVETERQIANIRN